MSQINFPPDSVNFPRLSFYAPASTRFGSDGVRMGSARSRAPHSLMSWLIVLLVLGASQIAFKRWQANVSYRVSLTLPIVANTFEIAADEAVPADTREILGERTAPLEALGFERL